ncbi:hypothetical protein D3C75_769360 [compost metagenome]
MVACPGEIHHGAAIGGVQVDADADDGAVVHLIGEGAGLQRSDGAADGFLGVVLNMAHIGGDDGTAELAGHADQFVGAARAGGDLGLQVGQVLIDVA